MVSWLRESGDLLADPTPTQRKANFYEKGDKPLEIVSTRQWYIRNGGRDADIKAPMLARGEELAWVPEHMRYRYDNWVGGLNGDWLISRQRFFGVPFPVWYPLDADGEPDLRDSRSPRPRPSSRSTRAPRVPAGYAEDQRGVPGGFMADPDVMDTWATSSLSPADRLRLGARPGAVRADLPDGPGTAVARHHPHLAVLPGGAGALREPLAALGPGRDLRLRDGPGPQEDVEVQGQRGGADRGARPVRRRRGALAGGQGPARDWTPRSTRRR